MLGYDGTSSKRVHGIWDGLILSVGKSNQIVRVAFIRVVPFDHGKIPQENNLPDSTLLYMSHLSNE